MTFSRKLPLAHLAPLCKLVEGTFSSRKIKVCPMWPACGLDVSPSSHSWLNGLGQFPTCTTMHDNLALKDEDHVLYFCFYFPVPSPELDLYTCSRKVVEINCPRLPDLSVAGLEPLILRHGSQIPYTGDRKLKSEMVSILHLLGNWPV